MTVQNKVSSFIDGPLMKGVLYTTGAISATAICENYSVGQTTVIITGKGISLVKGFLAIPFLPKILIGGSILYGTKKTWDWYIPFVSEETV